MNFFVHHLPHEVTIPLLADYAMAWITEDLSDIRGKIKNPQMSNRFKTEYLYNICGKNKNRHPPLVLDANVSYDPLKGELGTGCRSRQR